MFPLNPYTSFCMYVTSSNPGTCMCIPGMALNCSSHICSGPPAYSPPAVRAPTGCLGCLPLAGLLSHMNCTCYQKGASLDLSFYELKSKEAKKISKKYSTNITQNKQMLVFCHICFRYIVDFSLIFKFWGTYRYFFNIEIRHQKVSFSFVLSTLLSLSSLPRGNNDHELSIFPSSL